jgi:hypothetical protein
VQGVALGVLGLWLLAASIVAAIAGWMGTALAQMLRYAPLARRLGLQWKLMAAGPALAVGLTVLSMLLGAVGGVAAGVAMGLLTLLALGILWLVGIVMTLSCMSELAKLVERVRDARENLLSESRMQTLPGQSHGPGPRPC